MNAGDVILAVLLALLMVSYERREPIPWSAMWRALTRRARGQR
jgi:hypothetical protein